MEQRISLITLGVRDMEASARFYESLGWKRVESEEGIIAFDLIFSQMSRRVIGQTSLQIIHKPV